MVVKMDNEYYLKLNLQFFAESEGGEKTEEATPKKLKDAREEGRVAKSNELNTGVSLLGLFAVLKLYLGAMGNSFLSVFKEYFKYIGDYTRQDYSSGIMLAMVRNVFVRVLLIALPVYAVSIVIAIAINIYQVKWEVSSKPLKPKLSKINPISGFKKIISMDKLFELVKSLIKIGVIMYITYSTLKDQWKLILSLYDYTLLNAIVKLGDIVTSLGLKISAIFVIIGVADLIYQKMKFKKDLRMTKQEVKDEFKQSEGDPQIKGKIRSKMQEASRARMMQKLPEADVVITNPTHLAVAIKYDRSINSAPVVIAKGADYLAMRIKEIARENDIVIVENKPLARMLYHNVDIDTEIPQELYQMVAEVLVYVYELKHEIPATN